MSNENKLKNRIASLRAKHQAADAELQALELQPVGREQKIADLKKEKLSLKDEIARLEEGMRKSNVAVTSQQHSVFTDAGLPFVTTRSRRG